MTTLGDLKAEIADDLDRTDLTSQIATEISKAIRFYQRTRFYFNETRDDTFDTVADQSVYTATDAAIIPKFIELDMVTVQDGDSVYELDVISPKQWELQTADASNTGRPDAYAYFDRSFQFSLIPDAAYTIRPIGHIMVDEPASDAEANNPWMTEAFDLIRARVCAKLGLRKLRDADLAQLRSQDEAEELWRLNTETNSRVGTGFVTPTEF